MKLNLEISEQVFNCLMAVAIVWVVVMALAANLKPRIPVEEEELNHESA